MKSQSLVFLLLISVFSMFAQTPSADWQIRTAVLAAPESLRTAATVYGYNEQGDFVILRRGTNEIICIADDPAVEGFSASAYHQSLEPFMARGRQLKEEGKSFQERFDIREQEVKAGTLPMPERSTLYVLTGTINAATGDIENTYLRYVIYLPFATAESTGLPLAPMAPGGPWIMDPGTHRAHIMINPPKN
ncbi:MAG: hypothetical protein OEY56_10155 [Cyclobacteriaceae bacterium]|nr:hypothetical protein [Cyclobacteriaceae bacterium]